MAPHRLTLVQDRRRLGDVFEFDYLLEMYKPAAMTTAVDAEIDDIARWLEVVPVQLRAA